MKRAGQAGIVPSAWKLMPENQPRPDDLQAERDASIPQTCQTADGQPCEPADCEVNGPHYVTHPEVPRG
jgi:hypothetical protein